MRRPSITSVLVAVTVICTLAVPATPYLLSAISPGHRVAVSDIRPEIGLAFAGRLSDPDLSDNAAPTGAAAYLVETRRGGVLHRLDGLLGKSYAFSWLSALYDKRFPDAAHEVLIPLGPGGSSHDEIRKSGGGRFSVWLGTLYFSYPSNTSIDRISRVEVRTAGRFSPTPDKIRTVQRTLSSAAIAAALLLVVKAVLGWLRYSARAQAMARALLPGLAITLVICAILAAGQETYLRARGMIPQDQAGWPSIFVDNVGFVFEPNATFTYTNGLDFWTQQHANSLGFLDREPQIPKPPGTFRVLLVGDSFIEAAQIPIEAKIQSVLGTALRRDLPKSKIDVIGFGYSGTGQSNQLPFYERSRSDIKPDVVILLFVFNDFPNNSPLLEAVRNGWSPVQTPRLFMRKTPSGDCQRMPISADWRNHLLFGGTESGRVSQLKHESAEYREKLAGWDPAADRMDFIYFNKAAPLPPVFAEAVDLTKCALAEWKRLAEEDKFSLVVVAAENVTGSGPLASGQIERLSKITTELDLPLLDLHPGFARRGDVESAHWKYDLHWNATGHRWAAEEIAAFLEANGYLSRVAR